jgi:hypothetical protein
MLEFIPKSKSIERSRSSQSQKSNQSQSNEATKKDNITWFQKYAPRNINEMKIHHSKLKIIREWFKKLKQQGIY